MRCIENCNTLQLSLVNRKGPILLHDSTWAHIAQPHFKSWTNWAMVFSLIHLLHWPLTNRPSLLQASRQLIVGKMLPQSVGDRKCFPRVHWILSHGFLCYRNKQTFLIWQKCVDCYCSYLINKDVFELNIFNDLKFTAWKHNYFFTNLISQTVWLKQQKCIFLQAISLRSRCQKGWFSRAMREESVSGFSP